LGLLFGCRVIVGYTPNEATGRPKPWNGHKALKTKQLAAFGFLERVLLPLPKASKYPCKSVKLQDPSIRVPNLDAVPENFD
jgi:hypothetical protein